MSDDIRPAVELHAAQIVVMQMALLALIETHPNPLAALQAFDAHAARARALRAASALGGEPMPPQIESALALWRKSLEAAATSR